MKFFKVLFYALLLSPAVSAFAAEPVLKFGLNGDSLSYTFNIENSTDSPITCADIEVQAQFGNKECTQINSTYKYKLTNKVIPAESTIVNSNFGLDFSYRQNLKDTQQVFCGQPQFTLNCK